MNNHIPDESSVEPPSQPVRRRAKAPYPDPTQWRQLPNSPRSEAGKLLERLCGQLGISKISLGHIMYPRNPQVVYRKFYGTGLNERPLARLLYVITEKIADKSLNLNHPQTHRSMQDALRKRGCYRRTGPPPRRRAPRREETGE